MSFPDNETELEIAAKIMNYAYRHSANRENCISLATHHQPFLDLDMARCMWEAIDAYNDNDQSGIKALNL